MSTILEWETRVVLAAQGLGPALATPMRLFSFLGTEEFFLVLLTLVYWCVSASVGLRLALLLLAADASSGLLKLAFHMPRPFWYDTRVRALSVETSYGLPSGHATVASAVWPFLARELRKGWAWPAAIAVVLLISISRVYLGMHFPSDVLGGWVVGAVVLFVLILAVPRVARGLASVGKAGRVALAVGASALAMLLTVTTLSALQPHKDPPVWAVNAAHALPGQDLASPRDPQGLISGAGLILGMGLGVVLAQESARFDAGGPLPRRAARFLLGILGVLILWRGLALVLPAGESWMALMFRYFRYALTGLWAVYVAPWLFLKLGLAQPAVTR